MAIIRDRGFIPRYLNRRAMQKLSYRILGYIFKTIRGDKDDFWDQFAEELVDPGDKEKRSEKRTYGPRLPFTIRRNPETQQYEIVETAYQYDEQGEKIRESPSLYEKTEKMSVTKHQSTSFSNPAENYEPPFFGWNRADRNSLLVGVSFDPADCLFWEILLYDGGTFNRSKDFMTREEAQAYLDQKIAKNIYLPSLKKLVIEGKKNPTKYNEVLAGLKWNFNGSSQITIFSDNLESRLLAQLRAFDLKKRLEGRYPDKNPVTVPISIYPDFNLYSEDKQKSDFKKAKKDKALSHYAEAIEFITTGAVDNYFVNFKSTYILLEKLNKKQAENFLKQHANFLQTDPENAIKNIENLHFATSKIHYDASINIFNAAISIAKIVYQDSGNFNNKALKILLRKFIDTEVSLINALKQLPVNSWMSFIETVGITCSNSLKNAVLFITEKKINPDNSSDFLSLHDTLEQFGENYVKDFSRAVINYAENFETLNDPAFLIVLAHIGEKNKSNELNEKIKKGVVLSRKEDWILFLKKPDCQKMKAFLYLAELKESESLRLALAEMLNENSLQYYHSKSGSWRGLDPNEKQIWIKICRLAVSVLDNRDEIKRGLINSLNKDFLYFASKYSQIREFLSKLTVLTTPESRDIRKIIFETYLQNPDNMRYYFYDFGDNTKNKKNVGKSLYLQFRENDSNKLAIRVFEKLCVQMADDDLTKFFFYFFANNFTIKEFITFLSELNSDSRKRICNIIKPLQINEKWILQTVLISHLIAYMDSNSVDMKGVSYGGMFSRSTADTKSKLEDARQLMEKISNCSTVSEIKSEIEKSQRINNQIDSKRKLGTFFGKSDYAKCLEQCHAKTSTFESALNPATQSSPRTPSARP